MDLDLTQLDLLEDITTPFLNFNSCNSNKKDTEYWKLAFFCWVLDHCGGSLLTNFNELKPFFEIAPVKHVYKNHLFTKAVFFEIFTFNIA